MEPDIQRTLDMIECCIVNRGVILQKGRYRGGALVVNCTHFLCAVYKQSAQLKKLVPTWR